ncbi:glycosyltransferase family 4 protein [Bacillus sp. 7894-2]|uniref:glycosyltransferase family 4 protein n=1 Tax=Bacillus sp. 7894-2 TaxID=2021695 RepID=UPI000BA62D1D|nr:glycosyltransferase family 4 protein [Bacillus sp. 7894-2]PAE25789.1 hypothetical protein CHI10_05770 [Bacillus sp. 7894-2]
MQVLHICSYYIGNKLYSNLVKQLSFRNGLNQKIYIPIRDNKHFKLNQLPDKFFSVEYFYSNILNKFDRYLYFRKITKQMKDIEKKINPIGNIDFIHAHTVFSDGGTAYKLYKRYGINYIVNVRNSDINFFYKFGIHLRPFMYKILLNAQSIVFISVAYKERLLSLLPSALVKKIENKCIVVPNGIDEFWYSNRIKESKKRNPSKIKLLFMGKIDKNKNLINVIHASKLLVDKGYQVSLHVLGDGPMEEKCKELCNTLGVSNNVTFYGYVNDKELISSIMDKSDVLVLPSFRETFGLVYIEAMTRGLPVIYSKGQGIDGLFNSGMEVGFPVNPYEKLSIVESIQNIILRYDELSQNCIKESLPFSWVKTADKYYELYSHKDL